MRFLGFLTTALALVVLTSTRGAAADSDPGDAERARAVITPHDPRVFVAASLGLGGVGAGIAQDGQGHTYGNGGVGTASARVDLEAASPLWLSLSGRVYFGAPPLQEQVDARIGYELRYYDVTHRPDGAPSYERIQLRPLVGVTALRFADSPARPTTSVVIPLRAGAEVTLIDSAAKWPVWRGRLEGMWDAAGSGPGVEFETVSTLPVRTATVSGLFIGARIGYQAATQSFGGLDLGVQWEL